MRRLPSSVWGVAAAAVVLVPAVWSGGTDVVVRHELAIIVWAIVLLGLLTGMLPRALPGRSARPVVIGLVALAALSAIALSWTSSAERTVEELARIAGYGGLVTLGLLAVTRRAWKAAFGTAVVVALSHDRVRAASHAAVALVCTTAVAAVVSTQPEIATATGAKGATIVLLVLLGASARADALHAVRHERLNYRRWLMVALAEKQRGNDRAARRAYRTAGSLAPAASSFEAGLDNALRVGIRGLAP